MPPYLRKYKDSATVPGRAVVVSEQKSGEDVQSGIVLMMLLVVDDSMVPMVLGANGVQNGHVVDERCTEIWRCIRRCEHGHVSPEIEVHRRPVAPQRGVAHRLRTDDYLGG